MRRKIYKSLTAILLASTMITGVIQTPITSYASAVNATNETQNASERDQLKTLIEKGCFRRYNKKRIIKIFGVRF